MFQINFPKSVCISQIAQNSPQPNIETELVDIENNVVLIGANGSGKSRLGMAIHAVNQNKRIKRISSQRMIQIPEFTPQMHIEQARQNEQQMSFSIRPVTQIQSDYENLLTILFALETQRNQNYVKIVQESPMGTSQIPVPKSVIDIIKDVWKDVFPHLEIFFEDGKVKVLSKLANSKFAATQMSDGERVGLYLIAQCLTAETNTVFLIDEPELHLHKSLMVRLWNSLELLKSDCKFIYITHDLDFAASRSGALKIWVKKYNLNGTFEWEKLPDIDGIPESLLLEIVGSRKPILFVEGDKGSFDYNLYSHVYSNFTIIPRGGCEQVVQSVKILNSIGSFHQIKAFGLIDRDYKSEEEIVSLKSQGIYIIEASEIDNLLIMPDVLRFVAKQFHLDENLVIADVTSIIIDQIEREKERVISARTSLIVNYKLNALDTKCKGLDNIRTAVETLVSSINIDDIYNSNVVLFNKIVDDSNLENALKYFDSKGLISLVSKVFKFTKDGYTDFLMRSLKDDNSKKLIIILSRYLPTITV